MKWKEKSHCEKVEAEENKEAEAARGAWAALFQQISNFSYFTKHGRKFAKVDDISQLWELGGRVFDSDKPDFSARPAYQFNVVNKGSSVLSIADARKDNYEIGVTCSRLANEALDVSVGAGVRIINGQLVTATRFERNRQGALSLAAGTFTSDLAAAFAYADHGDETTITPEQFALSSVLWTLYSRNRLIPSKTYYVISTIEALAIHHRQEIGTKAKVDVGANVNLKLGLPFVQTAFDAKAAWSQTREASAGGATYEVYHNGVTKYQQVPDPKAVWERWESFGTPAPQYPSPRSFITAAEASPAEITLSFGPVMSAQCSPSAIELVASEPPSPSKTLLASPKITSRKWHYHAEGAMCDVPVEFALRSMTAEEASKPSHVPEEKRLTLQLKGAVEVDGALKRLSRDYKVKVDVDLNPIPRIDRDELPFANNGWDVKFHLPDSIDRVELPEKGGKDASCTLDAKLNAIGDLRLPNSAYRDDQAAPAWHLNVTLAPDHGGFSSQTCSLLLTLALKEKNGRSYLRTINAVLRLPRRKAEEIVKVDPARVERLEDWIIPTADTRFEQPFGEWLRSATLAQEVADRNEQVRDALGIPPTGNGRPYYEIPLKILKPERSSN